MSELPRIHILSDQVARKIAAGEVIERPQSVVRELLDNSLDAGASEIEVHLESGGNDLVRVVDNGVGMGVDDLERCYLPHATSKIRTDADLLHVRTLGFRGEALGSIAAVSRLTVTSLPSTESSLPHRIEVHGGALINSGPAAGDRGTSVEVRSLFYNIPARKRFLKRPQAESSLVRSVFVDKALAHPEVSFRLFSESELRLYLPGADQVGRIAAAFPGQSQPALLQELHGSGDGFRFTIVAGEPSGARRDRKHLQVFVNRRRIREYALVQAVEYAYRDYLHGGLFPVAYLFLEVDPELVDFNVHPAKREARFRNLPVIHRRIVDTFASHLRAFNRSLPPDLPVSPTLTGLQTHPVHIQQNHTSGAPPTRWSAADANLRTPAPRYGPAYDLSRSFQVPDEHETIGTTGVRYLGQIFGLFLVVERADRLYLVDQHAAHERIIYDRLKDGSAAQEMLFPVQFDLDPELGSALEEHQTELAQLGVTVRRTGSEAWDLTGVPAAVSVDAGELIEMIRELCARPADFSKELYASMSCRAAVKDGDVVSPATALAIISGALALSNARCPHGRPIWTEYSREDLMRQVGRL